MPELALELADTRLARVLADHELDGFVRDGDLVLTEAVAFHLPRPQVPVRDRDLLVRRVSVEADHLHPVEERPGDRLGHVPGGDEEDLREVELDVEVVVAERVVLRRVEHLEERRGRIAAPVGADLVDLVEHDHRVHRPGIAERADEPARQRADVRAAMAADLRLVADAAERHADELASGRARDRLPDGGLAGAGRADEREDRAGAPVVLDPALLAELRDRDVLDDAVLHVLEARVVGVQHLARVRRVEPLLGALAPRDGEQPVEVVADDAGLGSLVSHSLEPRELALGLLEDVLGHLRLGDLRPVLLDDGPLVLAELLADRVELAAEDVLALLLVDIRLDVLLDSLAHLHEREPLALELEGELEALAHVDGLEEANLLLEAQVGRVARRVCERTGLGDRAHEGRDAAVVAAQLEDLLDDRAILDLELADAAVGGLRVGPFLDVDEEAPLRVAGRGARDPAVQAVQGDRATAAGEADAIGHLGDGADLRVLVVVLGHEQHAILVADVDGEGDVHVGEDDEVFQGDEEQTGRVLGLAHGSRFRTNGIGSSEDCTGRARPPSRAWQPRYKRCARACVWATLASPSLAGSQPSVRRKRCSASAATRPASRSDESETPYDLYVMTPATNTPPCQKTRPGVVARRVDPAGLVEHLDAALGANGRVELRLIADVSREPEEIAGVRRSQPGLRRAQRPLPTQRRARSLATARSCPRRSCTCPRRRPVPRRREAGSGSRACGPRSRRT